MSAKHALSDSLLEYSNGYRRSMSYRDETDRVEGTNCDTHHRCETLLAGLECEEYGEQHGKREHVNKPWLVHLQWLLFLGSSNTASRWGRDPRRIILESFRALLGPVVLGQLTRNIFRCMMLTHAADGIRRAVMRVEANNTSLWALVRDVALLPRQLAIARPCHMIRVQAEAAV